MSGALLFAPNVHVGGGLVLLREVLACWPQGWRGEAWLDERARSLLSLPAGLAVHWVRPSLASRIAAQWALARSQRGQDELLPLLCFHGLPPFWAPRAPVAVYLQNRNLIEPVDWSRYPARIALRMRVERTLARSLRRHASCYWVQTPSMAASLQRWWTSLGEPGSAPVAQLPFTAQPPAPAAGASDHWDFVYVADGEGHKNHALLLQAWQLLAEQGLRPTLALTLTERDGPALALLEAARKAGLYHVQTLGALSHAEVLALYRRSRALVFPSRSESFGLPLLEARQAGLPIVAGELDFVRDVCEPVQTFDPQSPRSLARAVRRFLGQAEAPLNPVPPETLWQALQHLKAP